RRRRPINAAGGPQRVLGGGSRGLTAQRDNRGLPEVEASLFSLGKPSATHVNSGTISVTSVPAGGDFFITQTGTNPSFTNTGTISIGSGATFEIRGGAFNQNTGTISGAGTFSLT